MLTESNITIVGHGSGNPSKKVMRTYLTSRYNGTKSVTVSEVTANRNKMAKVADETRVKVADGVKCTWHKGLIRVRRARKITPELIRKTHAAYTSILGRNIYSNDKRNFCFTKYSDGKYYSDCSSSTTLAMKQAGVSPMSAYNTVGILTTDSVFEDVPVTIEHGHITKGLELLRTCDLLLFAGSDFNRQPDHVGHVEMVYEIDGKIVTGEPTATPTPAPEKPTPTAFNPYKVSVAVSTNSVLNIRKQPNTNCEIVGELNAGHKVTIRELSSDKKWGKVDCYSDSAKNKGKEVVGWIFLQYTKKI